MRKDMSKVIVERPRLPGYDTGGSRRGRLVDPDLMLSHEGMRAPYVRHWGGKQLNENLAPLRRFIHSRVGRRWDDVYSEISENLRPSNAVQQHVRDHIEDFVSVRTRMIDGEIWVITRFGSMDPLSNGWTEFYVDPRDGLLCRYQYRETYTRRMKREQERRMAEEARTIHVAVDGTEYRKIDGIWYEAIWEQVPAPYIVRYTNHATGEVTEHRHEIAKTDVFTKKVHRIEGERYRSGRRQIGRQELRRRGLSNE